MVADAFCRARLSYQVFALLPVGQFTFGMRYSFVVTLDVSWSTRWSEQHATSSKVGPINGAKHALSSLDAGSDAVDYLY